jgi:hypothetical protein
MKYLRWFLWFALFIGFVFGCAWLLVARTPYPEHVAYGVSFNTMYARELGLDWEEVYKAILTDLGVTHIRLAAHWPMVSPKEGVWNFEELDTQIKMAEENEVEVVLAVGRRLPRWPECHVPVWAKEKTWDEQKEYIREYLRVVVERYKDSPAIAYFQVENEPFLGVYAEAECGELDKDFLDEEIALVKELDKSHPVLVTDSGNLGTWFGAYKRGDAFGTSVYVYLWNEATGPIETILPPEMYIVKRKTMELFFGKKESILIELSLEPWLNSPITKVDIETQLTRMSLDRFENILSYARETRFSKQYLWGAEWWYWLKVKKNHPEYWERAKALYADTPNSDM